MIKSFYGFLLFFLLFTFSTQKEKNFLVIQILNVGAHFPKEIKKEWVTHLNDLTHIGMRQLYLLGREMANNYILKENFLREFNIPSEVIIKAAFANDNLTVASAYAYSRGLYPPGTGQRLSADNIERAVAPFHGADYKKYQKELADEALPHYYDTVPIMVEGGGPDYLLSAIEYCEGLKKIVSARSEESRLKNERSSLWNKAKDAIDELKENFGEDIKELEDTLKYRDYFESAEFFAEEISIKEETMNHVYTIYKFIKFQEYYDNPLVAQIVSNGVLKEVENALDEGIKNPEERKKLLTYVVEDQNVYAFLKLINGNEEYSIPYASLLEIKVVTNDEDKKFVSAFFNGQILKWNNEITVLSLQDFEDWIKKNTYNDKEFMSMCINGKDIPEEDDDFWFILGISLTPIMVIVIILTIIYAMRKSDKTEPLNVEPIRDEESEVEYSKLEF